jgi:membrane-associated phospholipid phosphatase
MMIIFAQVVIAGFILGFLVASLVDYLNHRRH